MITRQCVAAFLSRTGEFEAEIQIPMKIQRSTSVSTAAPVSKPSNAATSATSNGAPVAPLQDTASILGLSEAELTPKVREAIMSLMAEVDSLRRELASNKSRLIELEQLADANPLVPTLNRRAFLRELTRIMAFSERYEVQASLVYLDLDNLKQINDTHGHAAGDAALSHVATLLEKNVRASDAVGRLGGDEFGIILARGNLDAAVKKASLLADLISRRPLVWNGQKLNLSVSHGAYSFQRGEDANDALARADEAMYQQKARRKA